MPTWIEFLQQQGAQVQNNSISHFSNNQDELNQVIKHNIIAELSPMGILAVSGQDAADFLQGQLSCDIKQVSAKASISGTYCNQQGRVIATFRAIKHDDQYYLYMPLSIVDTTLAKLQKYAVFSQVQLQNISSNMLSIGLSGPKIRSIFQAYFSQIPQACNQICNENGYLIIRIPGPYQRFIVFASNELMQSLWQKLSKDIAPVSHQAWHILDIISGIPNIYPQTQEKYLPHRLNLHRLDYLDFHKGCYLGQEIIARMHYRGQLKHQMVRLWLATSTPILPGTIIKDPNDKAIGQIVDSAIDPEYGVQALVIIPVQTSQQKQLKIDNHIVQIKYLDLPYA